MDVKELVDDAKDKISQHIQNEAREAEVNQMVASTNRNTDRRPRTYADALVNPPPHANPRLAAREGIKARQFMLEDPDSSLGLDKSSAAQLKIKLNGILAGMGHRNNRVRSAIVQKRKGILMELETDEAATWMNDLRNHNSFCEAIGANVFIRMRSHNVITFNVATTLNTGNPAHREEICEANNISNGDLVSIRWAKPADKRRPGQKTGHLLLSFSSANAANRAITNRLVIFNRRVMVEKTRKEPLRCMKCQGWGHFANQCMASSNRCGNCAENHRKNQCPNPKAVRCISCGTEDHPSWNRACPVFRNRRHPENQLHFIPADKPWTWMARQDPPSVQGHQERMRDNQREASWTPYPHLEQRTIGRRCRTGKATQQNPPGLTRCPCLNTPYRSLTQKRRRCQSASFRSTSTSPKRRI